MLGLIWPVLIQLLVSVCAETDWEVAMVADVVHGMRRPSAVIAALCWLPNKNLQLHSALAKLEDDQTTTIQFFKPGQIPERMAQEQHVVFLADLSCENISIHLNMSKLKKHFRSPYRWILLDTSFNETGQRIPDIMKDVDVLPDGEVLIAQRRTLKSYQLYFIYKTGKKEKRWRTESFATWDIYTRLWKVDELEKITALRRKNLHQYEIAASLVLTNNDSLNHLTDGIDDYIDTVSKANYPAIEHLLDYINATKKFIFVNSWGYYNNGTWTGMCGLIVRGEVEIGGSPIFITKERRDAMDFVSMPTPTDIKFVFIQPKLSYTQNLYVLSFSPAVWRSLLALVLLIFIVLFAVAKWEWKKNEDYASATEFEHRKLRGNMTDVAVLVFGAICQQGSPAELKSSLGRQVTLLMFVTLMFIYTSYSANIVALLQSSSSQIRSIEDLLYSRIKLGVDDTVYNKYFFSTVNKPVQKALYQTKIAPPGGKPQYFPLEEGIRRVQQGLFAFHVEIGVGYKFVNKLFREGEKCGLQEIDFLQLPKPWQSVPKYTPYLEMYKIGFKRIKEAGLQTRQNIRLYDKRPICSGRESNFISVSMVDCYPALLELAYGMLIALFVLVIEVLIDKRERIINKVCSKLR